jgi:hypothetical protein
LLREVEERRERGGARTLRKVDIFDSFRSLLARKATL